VHVLVAPDSFTGTLTAVQAAEAMAAGWLRHDPGARLDLAPMSDGGPGFVQVLHASLAGQLHAVPATGPLGEPVLAQVLRTQDGTVYVEAAQVCGLELVAAQQRRPLDATTAGVGLVLRAVLERLTPSRVVVGVGGTASTDGGRGAVDVLGGPDRWPDAVPLVVATDVDAPLTGPNGAATVFGPQKGASAADVRVLDDRLRDWAGQTGGDPQAPGAGAGGGLGYGLMLLGGIRVSGVQTVLDAVGLPGRAQIADLVLTGEGTFDATSLQGKVPRGVAWVSQRAGCPCVVLAGRVMIGRREFSAAGVDAAYAVEDSAGSLAQARLEPAARLADLAERVSRTWTPRAS
jgi:glycerate 2-kinase